MCDERELDMNGSVDFKICCTATTCLREVTCGNAHLSTSFLFAIFVAPCFLYSTSLACVLICRRIVSLNAWSRSSKSVTVF